MKGRVFLQKRHGAPVQICRGRSGSLQGADTLSKGNFEIINNVYKERKQP